MVRVFVCLYAQNPIQKSVFLQSYKENVKKHVNCCANTDESYVPSVQPLTLHLLKCPMPQKNANEGSVLSVQPLTLRQLNCPMPQENTNERHASAFCSATDITLTLTTCLNVPCRGKIQTKGTPVLSAQPLTLCQLNCPMRRGNTNEG